MPKGPSLDPAAKRLAVQVDDHGMEHLDFEDETSKIVWDTGALRARRGAGSGRWPADTCGSCVLGEKIRGGFALTRTRMGGNERNWLLLKIDDEYADADAALDDHRSVLTGRERWTRL